MKDSVIGMAHAAVYPFEGPKPEEQDVSPPKATDASTLQFPLPLVIGLVVFAAAVVGSTWTTASNIRDINTRLEMQTKIDEANRKLQDERMGAMKSSLDDLQRRLQLAQYEMQQFKDSLSQRK
jgi:hypothetical protein